MSGKLIKGVGLFLCLYIAAIVNIYRSLHPNDKIKNDEILFIEDSLLDYRISLEANLKFMGIGSLISQRIKKNIFCIESFNQTEDIFSKFTLKQKKIF